MGQPWRNTSRRPVTKTASVPAPIGGLNARDSVAAMPATDALILRNWFPLPYAVSMRKGWKEIAVGLVPGTNPTVAVYYPVTGAPTIVAFTGHNIYAIHAPGPAPAPAVTGMTSDYWQTTMYSNVGGNYLYAVNGVDSPQIYNGTAFTAVNNVAPPPTGFDISGVDPKKFVHVTVHMRRLWFVEKDSTQAWYLPVDQIGGEAKPFIVGQLFRFGGFLMAIYTWTVDAGSGMNDKLVFVSSNGECAVYSGTDPDSVGEWSLEGVVRLGAPVGRRCGVKYGGDLLLITGDGLVPFSASLQSTQVNSKDNLTDKIQHTISVLISEHKNVVGWEVLLFEGENQIWLVVPVPVSTKPLELSGVQVFAMNTITGAWAQYDNMDIKSSALYNDTPAFITGDGRVCQAWTGYFDNVPWDKTSGQRIVMEVVTAYSYFQAWGITKRWTMCRPIFQAGSIPESAIKLEVDFAVRSSLALPDGAITPSVDYLWDVAKWDEARWDSEFERYRRWQSVQGMGYSAALHMLVAQNTQTLWIAVDYVYELGGTI